MTVASADAPRIRKESTLRNIKVLATETIYGNTLVAVDANGWANAGADTSGLIFIGVADKRYDNSSGSNGDTAGGTDEQGIGSVFTSGLFRFTISDTVSLANVGDNVFISDDSTVALVNSVTNQIWCGKIANYVDANTVMIDIFPAASMSDLVPHIVDTSAHAGSAISGVAPPYFPAADNTATEQLQQLGSMGGFITIPRFTGWTKDGTAKTVEIPLMEFPVPIKIVSAFANVGTTPDAGKTLTLAVNTTTACQVVTTATQGEDKTLDIDIAANTNIVVTASETAGGTGANCDLILVWNYEAG